MGKSYPNQILTIPSEHLVSKHSQEWHNVAMAYKSQLCYPGKLLQRKIPCKLTLAVTLLLPTTLPQTAFTLNSNTFGWLLADHPEHTYTVLQLTSGGSLHGLEGLTATVYPLNGEVMLFQEIVKDCPGSLNCTVGLTGGGGSVKRRVISQFWAKYWLIGASVSKPPHTSELEWRISCMQEVVVGLWKRVPDQQFVGYNLR